MPSPVPFTFLQGTLAGCACGLGLGFYDRQTLRLGGAVFMAYAGARVLIAAAGSAFAKPPKGAAEITERICFIGLLRNQSRAGYGPPALRNHIMGLLLQIGLLHLLDQTQVKK